MAYLVGTDPAITKRNWQDVMDDIIKDKQGPTLRRWRTAIRDKAFNSIRHRIVIETLPGGSPAGFAFVGRCASNVYLRRLQNHCLGMGWLPVPILPQKLSPKIIHGEKQAITWEEHCRIVARESQSGTA